MSAPGKHGWAMGGSVEVVRRGRAVWRVATVLLMSRVAHGGGLIWRGKDGWETMIANLHVIEDWWNWQRLGMAAHYGSKLSSLLELRCFGFMGSSQWPRRVVKRCLYQLVAISCCNIAEGREEDCHGDG
ncbi:hypothetical protein M0R45_037389 [Rubus argutus]|uniref:Uncharacterized protein n=1 Tax=Rubus argutus TaxID=59490 RepID=A0AAW1W1G0_RUBAR